MPGRARKARLADYAKFKRDTEKKDVANQIAFNSTSQRLAWQSSTVASEELGPGAYDISKNDMVSELSKRLRARNRLLSDMGVSHRSDFTKEVPGSPDFPGPGCYEVAGDFDALDISARPTLTATLPPPPTKPPCSRPHTSRPTATQPAPRELESKAPPFATSTQRFKQAKKKNRTPAPGAYEVPRSGPVYIWKWEDHRNPMRDCHQSVFKIPSNTSNKDTGTGDNPHGRTLYQAANVVTPEGTVSHYMNTMEHQMEQKSKIYKFTPHHTAFSGTTARFSNAGTVPKHQNKRQQRIERLAHENVVKKFRSGGPHMHIQTARGPDSARGPGAGPYGARAPAPPRRRPLDLSALHAGSSDDDEDPRGADALSHSGTRSGRASRHTHSRASSRMGTSSRASRASNATGTPRVVASRGGTMREASRSMPRHTQGDVPKPSTMPLSVCV